MIRRALPFLMTVLAGPAMAETLVASHTIRSKTILTEEHVSVIGESVPGALSHPLDAVGMEALVVLYAGRPIRPGDLGPPAVIDRNQIVTLIFRANGLTIATEGRSLVRAAEGERVRVMNLASRSTVTGTVDDHGRVFVGPSEKMLSDLEID